jgi:hypothetical protein
MLCPKHGNRMGIRGHRLWSGGCVADREPWLCKSKAEAVTLLGKDLLNRLFPPTMNEKWPSVSD